MPYETLDMKNNAIFKIGMTLNFKNRVEEYHTYFPNGVYHIAYLADPPLKDEWIWTDEKKQIWKDETIRLAKETNKKRGNSKKSINVYKEDFDMSQKTAYYKDIEKFLFEYVKKNNGRRIFSTTRVRHAGTNNKGETEWIYGDEDLIHEAFDAAKAKYGGELQQFYLQGTNPDTGEIVKSINEEAKDKLNMFPNYTGRVIFNY
jgi:hypothetical protein